MESCKFSSDDVTEVDENKPCNNQDVSSMKPSSNGHGEMESGPAAVEELDIPEVESGSENHSFEHKEPRQDVISDILEVECGEPMKPQELRIDFNPLEGLDDNEFVLNKCMSFWKLIEENPQIHHLKALPEKDVKTQTFNSSVHSSKSSILPDSEQTPNLEAIKILEKEGPIVDNIFVSKFRRCYCEEGSGDYFDVTQASTTGPGAVTKWVTAGRPAARSRQEQQDEVTKLCTELKEWDIKNPKSMKPPGHAPLLSYAVMQKNF